MKKIFIIIAIVSLFTALSIYLKTRSAINEQQNNPKIAIVASFYPLAYFAQQIGGDKVLVTNITPSGAEPHDYEPTTSDIEKISQSDLLILNGLGLESWGTKIENKKILTVSDGIGQTDPHIWLDPLLAQKIVKKITMALSTISPANQSYFETNGKELTLQLSQLDEAFKRELQSCAQHQIVTSHAAFSYLAARYGFSQVAIAGLSPDEEPTPQKLSEVTKLVKEKKIHYIFFETLVSSRLAETLATETHAKTLVFNPLEGLTPDEVNKGSDYFSVQQENLQSLRTALSCM